MLKLPQSLASRYRIATEHEVRSQSFGPVKLPRNPNATGWEQQKGTLDDQAIFGPRNSFERACGKYRGQKHENMICDCCGVKVGPRALRRKRCGHIELPSPIFHPLGDATKPISAIPVLPASICYSPGGKSLLRLYDDMILSINAESPEELSKSFKSLVKWLIPTVVFAHEWNLQDAELLAFGLALVLDSCGKCGYPLEGLDVEFCPGSTHYGCRCHDCIAGRYFWLPRHSCCRGWRTVYHCHSGETNLGNWVCLFALPGDNPFCVNV